MKLIATMPVRNEAWIVGLTLRAALNWCDEVVVLDHNSTDETSEILLEVWKAADSRVHRIRTYDADWNEMQHRQMMLEKARERGATHIAMVDADEILTANLVPIMQTLKQSERFCPPGSVLMLPGFNLRHGLSGMHANGIWGERWFSTVFCDDPRLSWLGDTFHHREPHGFTLRRVMPITHREGGVMHLWGANERRLRAKHALYKMVERLRWPWKTVTEIDQMYSLWRSPADARAMYGGMSPFAQPWVFSQVPHDWWQAYEQAGLMQYLDLDREPWQEGQCKSLLEQHGAGAFAGLDLFGVID